MNASDIFNLARKGGELYKNAKLSEQMLYTTARNIYRSYDIGIITAAQAQSEKNLALKQFGVMELGERAADWDNKVRIEMSVLAVQAEKCGCEICRKMVRLYDHRDTPAGFGKE